MCKNSNGIYRLRKACEVEVVIHCRPSMKEVPVNKGIKTYFLAFK